MSLILTFGASPAFASSRCEKLLSNEYKSVLDSNQDFLKLARGGIVFSTFAHHPDKFPFSQFPKGTKFAIQEVTHAGWGWTKLHTGTLKSAGDKYLVLEINGKGTRFATEYISGVALIPDQVQMQASSSEEFKSVLDSIEEFKKLAKAGITFSSYAHHPDKFPFSQFPKGTKFAIQEVTHAGWGWTKLHKGTLKRADDQYLYLDIEGTTKRLNIDYISGIALFF